LRVLAAIGFIIEVYLFLLAFFVVRPPGGPPMIADLLNGARKSEQKDQSGANACTDNSQYARITADLNASPRSATATGANRCRRKFAPCNPG